MNISNKGVLGLVAFLWLIVIVPGSMLFAHSVHLFMEMFK